MTAGHRGLPGSENSSRVLIKWLATPVRLIIEEIRGKWGKNKMCCGELINVSNFKNAFTDLFSDRARWQLKNQFDIVLAGVWS